MGEFFEKLDDKLREFIKEQHVFFTATAAEACRINLSPKGMDLFRVLDEKTVAYLDVTGSSNETAAHIENDGRMTIMMCSFTAKPRILRLYGRGRIIRQRDAAWDSVHARFDAQAGERQIIALDIESVQTSCGYGVPFYEFKGHRDTMKKWNEAKGPEGIAAHWKEHNVVSIDGLPTHLLSD